MRTLGESVKKYLYLSLRKMLPSAVANYLGKINDYPKFSLWILRTLAKIYFFHVFLIWRKHVSIL